MCFNLHIDNVIARSNKNLGFIIRNTKPFTNIRALIILYVSIIRSIVEYGVVIWAPSYITHIMRLEKVQRKFIKFLCFKCGIRFDSCPYEQHLQYFSLPHLLSRRRYFDIIFAFKALNSLIGCVNVSSLFELHIPSREFRHTRLLEVEYHRTNYGKHSPLVRICNEVNAVQIDLLTDSLATFKKKLRALLF